MKAETQSQLINELFISLYKQYTFDGFNRAATYILFYSDWALKALQYKPHSLSHTQNFVYRSHTRTHKCIGGKSGFNILPETWIESLAFQLADDLLFFVSHSHPGEWAYVVHYFLYWLFKASS